MWIKKQVIEGQHVILEPLCLAHTEALSTAVNDGEHWRLWFANVPTPDSMDQYIAEAISQMEKGNIAYAVRHKATNQIVGTTRYYGVDRENKRALIGYTWYANSVRRTAVNTECKYLLLKQLFEQSKAIAVEFRTHVKNDASRTAIERLGAKQDGILRNHQILKDGSIRDTAVYSILNTEWPNVKEQLLAKLCK
ncbi:GNAT family N-acetyltransferase [Pseudoalteromonas sp. T1lg24]|uniref:GNAT family N-acetyltransferase n=1 Tax=Pseudoalteromonas sp. T1lg24 TaxID=2077099 RepID=UPI000CF6E713|nr:GNAT family protein [Pseudoalteromonas sp. T1lg24]